MSAEDIENYPNELDVLSEADDVQGNGVFDPNLTHGNVHPNEGVFADHQSLPGYIARDDFFTRSSVRNITQGGRVEYVPGGAVSFQQGQLATLRRNQLLWEVPSAIPVHRVPDENTVSAPTPVTSVSGIWPEDPNHQVLAAALVLGTLTLGYFHWKKHGKRWYK